MKTWTTIAAIATAMAIAAVPPQPVTLKRSAKVGDYSEYEMTLVIFTQGLEVNVTFDKSEKVTKVGSDDSYTIFEKQTNLVMTLDGNEIPGGELGEGTITRSADGQITKIVSNQLDDDSYRRSNLINMTWPNKPVDVGSTWEAVTKADPGRFPYDIVKTYEILAREQQMGHDTFKVKVSSEELDGQASGAATYWLDVKTGVLVKAVGKLTNSPTANGPIDATFTAELKNRTLARVPPLFGCPCPTTVQASRPS